MMNNAFVARHPYPTTSAAAKVNKEAGWWMRVKRGVASIHQVFMAQQPIVKVENRQLSLAEWMTHRRSPEDGFVTLWCEASPGVVSPSDRVRVIPIQTQDKTPIGRMWLYLYPEKKVARRVFKVDAPEIRRLLNAKTYYMTDLPYTPDGGEAEMDALDAKAAAEVGRLINLTAAQKQGQKKVKLPKPTKPGPADAQSPAQSAPAAAPAVVVLKSELSAQAQPVNVPVSVPVKADAGRNSASSSVPRPVKGERYEGIVVEMGMVPRSGYDIFCLKLDIGGNGTHMPIYGVELEREVMERQVVAGDQVIVVFMGRQDLGHGKTKNLYKVEKVAKA